ncbi:SMC family ATPase [Streptomyces tateyamensis]|uniref:Nuclease SbcCD subunit C n=1 Tax=Streptomyces tateyamensis TaxID=565073 RepID=A0A2V4NBN9_9ACTN|nr:SMC family ATPase [Streptomyces tateyamensis]PYC80896.1 SMC family ATPase [Streptomyces tateyamensis]
MRLHRLAITAFGPFAGRAEVDFDELAAGGLFLLRGATGAGKSSVLDAVCFALYGELPGARRANRMRSDHADPQQLTEVVLELTLAGRRLEVTRLPEQRRPKKRGAGWTTEKAQTLVREWVADAGGGAPGWQAVTKSHQEAGEELQRLVGMSRDQFCQVVLLPQGDFARFLRADAADRAALLGKLFDTERYRRVEGWLAEQRRAQEAQVQAGRQRLGELTSRLAQAAGVDRPEPAGALRAGADRDGTERAGAERPGAVRNSAARAGTERAGTDRAGAELDTADALGWAAVLRTEAAELLTVRGLARAAAEQRHAAAQAELTRAQQLAQRQARHAEARRREEALTADAPREAAEHERLALAQAALAVESALRRHGRTALEYEQARTVEEQARAALARRVGDAPSAPDAAASSPGTPDPQAPAPVLDEVEAAVRAALGRLEVAAGQERRLAELAAQADREQAERLRAEQDAADAEQWLADHQARAAARQQQEEHAQAAATEADRLAEQRAEADQRLTAARRRDQLAELAAQREQALLSLRSAALDAREHTLDLRRRRLDGMAAELAARLHPGAPCPVCGSAEHPAPAAADAEPVREADERAAVTAQQAAEQRQRAAEGELTELRVQAAAADASAAGHPAAELAERLADLAERHRAALQAAERLTGLLQERERLAQRQQHHTDQLQRARERVASCTAALTALTGERETLTAQVAAARGDAASVADRAARLARLADALAAAARAARATEQAAEQDRQAAEELALTAREAGFAAPEDARRAALAPADLHALRERLAARAAERRAVAEALADPELSAAAQAAPADPAGAQLALQAALTALQAAGAAEHAATERVTALRWLGGQLAALAAELAPRLAAFGELSRLAQLAAGTSADNRLRMRLESYVLAARLEQVAAAASDRLVRMSGGRYTLVHSDERTGGGRRSGLSLLVVDAWTGTERDTATLSGGESFFASLALALGLADVVTDEAGGMPLDTLFIDEGFGTLDEQALEEVLDVLDSLRERDRAVGIVSHVADLRHRIPTQLVVHKSRHGSTLRHAGPSAP